MRDIFFEEEVEGGELPPLTFPDTSNLSGYPVLKYDDGGKWRDQAKCLGQHELLSVFFPETGRGNRRKPIVVEAKKICADCAVRKECFNFAKKNEFIYGIWGGVDFFKPSRPNLRETIPDSID